MAAGNFDFGDLKVDPASEASKPAFQALIYPGNSKRFEVVNNTPPVFLLAGYNDEIAKGIVDVYLKYKNANVPAELHIYSNAGHGFGLREKNTGAVTGWIDRFYEWLLDRELVKSK